MLSMAGPDVAQLRVVYFISEKVREHDQEIPQSHTSDQPMEREEEPKNFYSNMTSVRQ